MKRVFISYSRTDKTFAERLARDLNDAGLDVWIDFRNIQGGQKWEDEIFKGIAHAEIAVVCLSPVAVESKWVRREILLARSQHKVIIPIMVAQCLDKLAQYDELRSLLDIQIINIEERYEQAFLDIMQAFPGISHLADEQGFDETAIPNPFKGLEAFQQTDADIFFGREELIEKLLGRLRENRPTRFLAVVGASGSGKSSLVRAGLIPALRAGKLSGSTTWPVAIFTPGARPIEALATRLLPIISGVRLLPEIVSLLEMGDRTLHQLVEGILTDSSPMNRLVLVIDQFEEVFTRASQAERDQFLGQICTAAAIPEGRTTVIVTMRADFFDRLSGSPALAELFERENMVIVTQMTTQSLRRSIEGPTRVVGLAYEEGLPEHILEEVRQQPGSLPLLQYALKELYQRRQGRQLTFAAYEEIGGVWRALAQHAESIYKELSPTQQDIMRRVLLQLVEVSEGVKPHAEVECVLT